MFLNTCPGPLTRYPASSSCLDPGWSHGSWFPSRLKPTLFCWNSSSWVLTGAGDEQVNKTCFPFKKILIWEGRGLGSPKPRSHLAPASLAPVAPIPRPIILGKYLFHISILSFCTLTHAAIICNWSLSTEKRPHLCGRGRYTCIWCPKMTERETTRPI